MKNKFKFYGIGLALASLTVLNTGCEEKTEQPSDEIKNEANNTVTDPQEDVVINIGGQIFSIPSPVQTAFLIKDLNVDYSSDYLNPSENADNYSTPFLKALNLGVYGADLGYLTIYEQTDNALNYLKSVRGISKELGLEGAFDDELANRFSDNIGNQDSMLVFVSEAYKNSDNYLKENDKGEVAALVLAGGWIESMYIAADACKETNHPQLVERLGDQKNALYSLIQMLDQYRTNSDYDDLVIELEDLYVIFENITYTYEFVPPVTDANAKLTTINSKHTVEVTEEDLNEIISKIESIRNEIVE